MCMRSMYMVVVFLPLCFSVSLLVVFTLVCFAFLSHTYVLHFDEHFVYVFNSPLFVVYEKFTLVQISTLTIATK